MPGYCDGDFVLTATTNGTGWAWASTAWGGRGIGPGRFQTAHGIFAHDDHIFVANRAAHEVVQFTKAGDFVRTFPDIPSGALICNVSRADNFFVFNALSPIESNPTRSAPM
jgi:hypothetical protein